MTKWKNINGSNPSPEDLRQMYAYHHYFGAKKVALIYPGERDTIRKGNYIDPKSNGITDMECSVILIGVDEPIAIEKWQEKIWEKVESWLNPNPEQSR